MKALLFDLDGTLANTDPLHKRAWFEVLSEHGISADDEFYARRISGRRNAEIVQSVLPHLSEQQGAAAAAHKEARFRELAAFGLAAMAGLGELLATGKRKKWHTAVVTNAPKANADLILQAVKLEFELVVLGDDLPRGKPDPLPYLEALRLLRIDANDAAAFEDSPSGIRSSVGAGIATVGVLSGHHAGDLLAAGASLCVADFAAPELPTWLEERS